MTGEMTPTESVKSIRKLSRSIERCKGSYAFLVGAGTSRAAGIKTSNELVEKWQTEEYNSFNTDLNKEEWVEEKEDYIQEYQNEYGFWFEQRYTTREERRQYIKEAVSEADPTFEHIVLASLMSEGYVPITLTPNFDDLIYDAFYLYIEKRPFLVDHNAIAPQFRITHEDPMIVKLHGDYLYDNLKNTASETSELEENITNVLKTTLNEYGLIVLGYSGRDESIMSVLNADDFEIPDYGLFWCTTDKENISPQVRELMKKENTFLVEVDSSKEFFYDIYENLEDLTVPTPVDIQERAKNRADQLEEDIIQVGVLEVLTLASEYNRRDEYTNAISLLTEAIESGEENPRLYDRRAWTYNKIGDYENSIEDYTTTIRIYRNADEDFNKDLPFDYENSITNEERAYHTIDSRARVHARNGNFDKAIEDFKELDEFYDSNVGNCYNLAESIMFAGDVDEGVEKVEEGLELAESTFSEIDGKMLKLIGDIIRKQDTNEQKEEFVQMCESNGTPGWNFKELDYFIDENNIDGGMKDKLNDVKQIYNENEDPPDFKQYVEKRSDDD